MNEKRLDGNAAAGLLEEVLAFETTLASTTCAGCGAVERVGALHVYTRAPGLVVRCAGCQSVQMRVARDGDRIWFDMSGVRSLELADA